MTDRPRLRRAVEGDLDAMARLGARTQADPTSFQVYFGEASAEIAAEIADVDAWTARTVVATDGERIVGWLLGERDDEIGRVWWWGPVVDPAFGWSAIAERLLDEALVGVAGGVEQFEFAVGDRHEQAIRLALARGYRRDAASVILTRPTATPLVPVQAEVDVREIDRADRDAVAALHDRTFPEGHLTGDRLATSNDDDVVLAAVSNRRVVGYLRAEIQPGGDGYIDFVGVDPTARRRGVGAALIAAAVDRLRDRGVDHVRLTVREDNVAARSLYERLRFDGSRVVVPLRLGFTP